MPKETKKSVKKLLKSLEKHRPRRRTVEKGVWTVGVDGKEIEVKGKKVTVHKRSGDVEKFVARGARDSVIRRIKDKEVRDKGLVKKSKRSTRYRT
tara:strand:- start:181 stop:465 length:285 start_codon:yes stop_codon:yes gene_type:complete